MLILRKSILFIFTISIISLAGCTHIPEKVVAVTENKEIHDYTPNFHGPWAEEFRQAYLNSPNNEIRNYLEDEHVSEAEKQSITDVFKMCLENQKLTFTDFNSDGSFKFSFESDLGPDEANRIVDECSKNTGVYLLIDLYFATRSNPENKDLSDLIVLCLMLSGVVPDNLTVEEYKSAPITEYSIASEFEAIEAVQKCESNPDSAF